MKIRQTISGYSVYAWAVIFWFGCAMLFGCQPRESKISGHDQPHKGIETKQISDSGLMKMAVRSYLKDSVSIAWEYTQQLLDRARQSGDRNLEMQATNLLGYINVYWNDYEASLQHFLKAQQIAEEIKDEKGKAGALLGLGRTYNMMKNSDKALEVLTLALRLCEDNQWKTEAAKMLLEIGNAYSNSEQYEKTLIQLEKAIQITREFHDTLTTIYILNNQGMAHLHLGKLSQAKQFLEASLKLNEKRGDAQAQSAALGNLGNVYIGMKEYGKAIDYIERSIAISEKQGFRVFTKDNYEILSRAYEMNQQYPEALRYYRRYSELGDSLFNEEKNKAIQAIEFRNSQQQKDQRISYLEIQNRNRSLLLKFTLLAISMSLVVLVLVIVSFRLRIKLHRKERTEMDETLSQKNRELVSMMLQSSQKEKLLEELQHNLGKLSTSKIHSLKILAEELNGKIKSMQEVDTDWQVLKTHFEEVHPNFFRTLHTRHPILSQNDLRICAYIRINLSSKDIARLVHISDRSVQTAKYRIKKKMQLPSELDLVRYINDL